MRRSGTRVASILRSGRQVSLCTGAVRLTDRADASRALVVHGELGTAKTAPPDRQQLTGEGPFDGLVLPDVEGDADGIRILAGVKEASRQWHDRLADIAAVSVSSPELGVKSALQPV
jgi:hypothetical protein